MIKTESTKISTN